MSEVPPPPAPPQPPVPPVPPPPPGGSYGYAAAGEPPLDQPYYGAPLPAAVRRFFTKYVVFSGRASRAEYWWWVLVAAIVNIVLGNLGRIHGIGIVFQIIAYIWSLGILIPGLALAWRRLHDANHSGWNFLWVLLPIVGWIILLVFYLQGPRPEGARFDR
jgi:uncharacterized membrane protein YhaH (DUF805 family)